MKIPDELLRAYRDTEYRVLLPSGGIILRVGESSPWAREQIAAQAGTGALFITAWNPFGRIRPDTENETAHAALRRELIRTAPVVHAGVGSSPDGNWQEDSLFACPVDRTMATDLCCRYRQNAVVFVNDEAVPELIFHPDIAD